MGEKQNDIKDEKRFAELKSEESEDSQNAKHGFIISKPAAVALAMLLASIVVAAVLITYYLPTCPSNPVPLTRNVAEFPSPVITEEEETVVFDGRLPETLKPIIYEVQVKPYLDDQDGDKQFSFDGELHFTFQCIQGTNLTILHILHLTINESTVNLRTEDNREVLIRSIRYEEKYDFVIFETDTVLQVGANYVLSLNYNGTLSHKCIECCGLYSVEYTIDDEIRYLAATQLQSVYARRVFPCFDEPNMKANFSIAITHRKKRQAYANMPLRYQVQHQEDWVTSYFDTSVYMSTYLVAMVVADFRCKETVTSTGVELRVCAIPEKIDSVDYSIRVGSQLMSYFQRLFVLPYILPKIDMVALPYPHAGAMENWGLVIYAEDNLLYNTQRSTPADKLQVARIVAHEIAHQWFGNIVTCSWWSDLWLNEGYARYLEGIGMEYVEQDLGYMNQFYMRDAIYEAMLFDSRSRSSHPIVMPEIGWPHENENMFDAAITYSKGGCISTMLESILGRDIYFRGLVYYLDKHQYDSTMSNDLFVALDEVAYGLLEKSLADLMSPWLSQSGHPFVTLTRTSNRTVHATQELFLLYKKDKPLKKYPHVGYQWYIPLTYTYEAQKDFDGGHLIWMNMGPATFDLPTDASKSQWMLANINHMGFYRVNYDLENWELLARQLKTDHTVIPVRNRGALISDALSLGEAQKLDNVIGLKLMEYLINERDYNPWYTAFRFLTYLQDMIARTSTYWYLQKFVTDLISPIHNELGWDLTSGHEIDYHKRIDVILPVACGFGLSECVQNATQHFRRWMQDPEHNKIRADIKSTVYRTGIQQGGIDEWNFAFERSLQDAEESIHLSYALGCSRDEATLKRYLEYGADSDLLWPTIADVRRGSALGLSVAWNHVVDNFDLLHNRFNNSAYTIVLRFAEYFNTPQDLSQLESFARQHRDMPGDIAYQFYRAVEIVKTNMEWMERNHQPIHDWLKEVTGQNDRTQPTAGS
ncbi:aminopeptidase N-like [Ptychodera flava]|uniref:aminopeptidase N-like n=1 Tax=Ptychodera flava TaxID=63121 RepID=UPI003969D966